MKNTLIILIIFFSNISNIFGCSCDTLSFEKATEWADEIFFGRIIKIREVETYQEEDGNYTGVWGALFEVEKKWKGSSDKYVEVFQPNTSCDFNFEFPSNPYIVYARNAELLEWDSTQSFVGLGTWLCARNADQSIYNNWREDGFDDRDRLDKKYPTPVKLTKFHFNWKVIGIGTALFIIGLIIGYIARKT